MAEADRALRAGVLAEALQVSLATASGVDVLVGRNLKDIVNLDEIRLASVVNSEQWYTSR